MPWGEMKILRYSLHFVKFTQSLWGQQSITPGCCWAQTVVYKRDAQNIPGVRRGVTPTDNMASRSEPLPKGVAKTEAHRAQQSPWAGE